MDHPSSTADELAAAVKCHQAGDFETAERIYKKVLSRLPDQADALHLIGVLAHQTGRQERAARYVTKAISINPGVADFHLNLGNIFQATGQNERAVECYKKALALNPRHTMALNNMANALMAMDRPEDAAEILVEAVSERPDLPVVHNTLGLVYGRLQNYELALESFETALKLDPSLFVTWINMGGVYQKLGKVEKALESYERAMELNPDRFETHFNLGNVFQESGQFDRAIGYYQAALRRNPSHVKSIYNIIQSRKYDTPDHPDRELVASMLGDPDLSREDEVYLHFAMAKLLNDCGDYDLAFSHFERANRRAGMEFDKTRHERFVSRLIATYSREYFDRFTASGVDSSRPVFIVGMPRSGTTLVEQILSSHPRVAGGGELLEIPNMVRRMPAELNSSARYPECMTNMNGTAVARLAKQYLSRLESVSATANRVTDKLPVNYLHLGMVSSIFPKATVVHCRRNPMDTCLSCYF